MRQTLCFTVACRIQLPLRRCKHSMKAILQSQHPEKPRRGDLQPFSASADDQVALTEQMLGRQARQLWKRTPEYLVPTSLKGGLALIAKRWPPATRESSTHLLIRMVAG